MAYEEIRILVAVAGTAIGAYYDIFNNKNVPDRFLFGFLAVSLLLNVFDFNLLFSRLLLGGLLIALLYVLYRAGQVGGADVVISAAIFAALPAIERPLLSNPGLTELLPLPSIFSVLAIAVFIFSFYVVIRFLPEAFRRTVRGQVRFTTVQTFQVILIAVSYSVLSVMLAQSGIFSFNYVILLGIFMFIAAFFIAYKDVMVLSMVKWTKSVEPEDVIALETLDSKLVERLKLERLVTEESAHRMMKLKRKWPVLDLPMFLPFVLAGLIVYVLIGDPLLYPF